MKIIKKKISDLKFASYNPRKISPKQMQDLKVSIQNFGFVEPVIINSNVDRRNIIISGHQRVKAYMELEFQDVPCIELDLNIDQEKELNIRMNKAGGEFDFSLLEENFNMDDLLGFGFEMEDFCLDGVDGLSDLTESENIKEDDYEMPEEIKTDIKVGDLIEIGEHRLLCGDSKKNEQVKKIINIEDVDLLLTDPPYGINYKFTKTNKNKEFNAILNDDKNFDLSFLFQYNCDKIIFGCNNFPNLIPSRGKWICWYKRGEGAENAVGNPYELAWSNNEKGYDKFYKIVHGGFVNSDGGKRFHPTQKPIK